MTWLQLEAAFDDSTRAYSTAYPLMASNKPHVQTVSASVSAGQVHHICHTSRTHLLWKHDMVHVLDALSKSPV